MRQTIILNFIESLNEERKQELAFTRTLLERVPENPDWKPHKKSMTLGRLATHISELPGWMAVTLNQAEINFAKEAVPARCRSTEELPALFDATSAASKVALEYATETRLDEKRTLRNGEQIYFPLLKGKVLRRVLYLATWLHHRAQLGVYLRLPDVSIPAKYGPSADEP